MLSMRPIATDDPVVWRVCLSCPRCAKAAERVEFLLGMETFGYPRHFVFNGGYDPSMMMVRESGENYAHCILSAFAHI